MEQLHTSLLQGLEQLDLRASETQIVQLLDYIKQLHQWNHVYNLTAVRDVQEMLVQHIFDCLAVIHPLQKQVPYTPGAHILDVGSGAGLPAVVLAIMLPEWSVTAVDAVAKKMAFVQQVTGVLKLKNLQAKHVRVEQLQSSQQRFGLVISRAFSSLTDFIQLTSPLLGHQSVWCAMKGKEPLDEIRQIEGSVNVFHVEQLHVPQMDAQRCLVWMRPFPAEQGVKE